MTVERTQARLQSGSIKSTTDCPFCMKNGAHCDYNANGGYCSKAPVIYALMPTIKSHEKFLPAAVRSFDAQVYPSGWRVFLRVDYNEQETLGAKLNRMVRDAIDLGATHIILLDDDDVHSPHRIQAQIQPLVDDPNLSMTGTSQIIYQKENGEERWKYSGHAGLWIGGLAFPISSWQKFKFSDKTSGVDHDWQHQFPLAARHDLQDESLMLCSIHAANSSMKLTVGSMWTKL